MLGNAIFDLVGRGAAGNSTILDKVSEGIESLAKAGDKALGSMTRLTEALTDLFTAPLTNAKQLASVIGPMVAAFNPGVVQQFSLALHDTYAVLGDMLMPVMKSLTVYVRQFGDVLAGMIPVISPLTKEIGNFIVGVGTGFSEMIKAAAPLIEVLSDGLGWVLRQVTYGIGLVSGAVTELLNIIADVFGLTSRFNANAKSEGFGTRNVRVGSVENFASEVFASNAKNAFSREGAEKSPQKASEELRKALNDGAAAMRDLTDLLRPFIEWLRRRFGDAQEAKVYADAIRQVVGNELRGVANALGLSWR